MMTNWLPVDKGTLLMTEVDPYWKESGKGESAQGFVTIVTLSGRLQVHYFHYERCINISLYLFLETFLSWVACLLTYLLGDG